jgi:hypothetical protein
MDKDVLVTSGQELVRLLDETKLKPRAAIWVFNPDNNIWRLWIVPAINVTDKNEFYRILSETISRHREILHGFDISSTELVSDNHPAIKGLKSIFRLAGIGSIHLANNTLNGFYLPDGIILRMAL